MAIAIIPINENPNGKQDNWLSMNKAVEMVCELFNEPVHPRLYCHNWFDLFIYFDWKFVKGFIRFESDYAYPFPTADEAILHFLHHCLFISSDRTLWEGVDDAILYVKTQIEPIIRMFYDKGYKIVSLNVG